MNRIFFYASYAAAGLSPNIATAQDVIVSDAAYSDSDGQQITDAQVQNTDTNLDEVTLVVNGRAIEQIGSALTGSEGTVGFADFENLPISRTGELVENVPGVIATQHSGTGKANQYFLRGFNLDHGTDFAGFVDGVPINMPTHGHGQGYLDFNFIIPETIERIDFRKGPYFADIGNFSAAGTIAFKTYDIIDPFVQFTLGQFGFSKATAAGSAAIGNNNILVAVDATRTDGPSLLDENLEKYNGLIKFSSGGADNGFSLQINGYHARWNATDQIPERAVESGLVDRFGFIDDDLGGETTRIGAVFNGIFEGVAVNGFATYSDLILTSNFTYFLNDPINGDEFQQADRRFILGGSANKHWEISGAPIPLTLSTGGNLRYDIIERLGLFPSIDAIPFDTIRSDEVDELNVGFFAEAELAFTPRLRGYVGVRGDYIGFDVESDLAVNSGSGGDVIFAPKFGLAWNALDRIELYANYGETFHSNDVRGATITVDPATGADAETVPIFARAKGAEIGGRIERNNFNIALVGFYLDLESELVFIGDAGATEPNDASRRLGLEANAFWKPLPWMTLDAVYAYTDAKLRGVASGQDEIPGAVSEVISGGMTLSPKEGINVTARLRHFGSAPLIEDGSVSSDPTTLVSLGAFYEFGRVRISAELFNLFDSNDADITYFYASQLASENISVEDRHFKPVEPRQIRVSIRLML